MQYCHGLPFYYREKEGCFMEDSILHGGVAELQELKNTLQEKNRYNVVLDSMESAVEEQREKIEQRKKEIELAMNEEIKRRRELVAKPFYDEMESCEEEMRKATENREQKRQELIEQRIQEETAMFEKRKENLEKQIKLVGQEEGVPGICTTRLFLAFFCPRTGKDAVILVIGLVLLLLVLPLTIYFAGFGGNDRQTLTTIYLVLIVVFYTLYLLINNLVKDKYLVGINKLLKLLEESAKLDAHIKRRVEELKGGSGASLDLSEYDAEVTRLQAVIEELGRQKNSALANFDSDQKLQLDIANEERERHKPELDHMRAILEENMSTYENMQMEYNRFLDEKAIEQKYDILLRVEPDIFNQTVIDELIFYITHGNADNISKAVMKRKKKLGEPISL